MKKQLCYLFFLTGIVSACHKTEKAPEDVPQQNTANSQYNTLTGTKWKQVHYYVDTTAYAFAHLNQWPLTTTIDLLQPYDTCWITSRVQWSTNGNWYSFKGRDCSSLTADTSNNGAWSLTSNALLISTGSTFNILELDTNHFKFYHISSTSTGTVVAPEYIVEVFESAN